MLSTRNSCVVDTRRHLGKLAESCDNFFQEQLREWVVRIPRLEETGVERSEDLRIMQVNICIVVSAACIRETLRVAVEQVGLGKFSDRVSQEGVVTKIRKLTFTQKGFDLHEFVTQFNENTWLWNCDRLTLIARTRKQRSRNL